MPLPESGSSPSDVLAALTDMKGRDVRWRDGRAFTLVYHGGDDVVALAEDAYRMFSGDNALNTDAFPSLKRIQTDVVDVVLEWTGANDDAAGFMTSGGTESILMAVLGARQRGRAERGIDPANIVLPPNAHAAFEEACLYFGVARRRGPVVPALRRAPGAKAAR